MIAHSQNMSIVYHKINYHFLKAKTILIYQLFIYDDRLTHFANLFIIKMNLIVINKNITSMKEGSFMEWTTEKRYLPYNKWDAETLLDLQAQADRSQSQLHYHIRPSSGLLNDPNGFSYFNGAWHVFYQQYPFGPVHGLKSWHHMKSTDLVHWEDMGLAVKPDTQFDSHGAYSGSATMINDKLFLMYTGNVRDQDWVRHSYQNGAWMNQDGNIEKLSRPLIETPDHVTEHFRDPQILKHGDKYYTILGAQDKETETGKIAIFSASNLTGKWTDLGYINFTDKDMGYMIECPNLVFVDDQPVLIFCPQGLDKKITSYENIYPNMYVTGSKFKFDAAKMTTTQDAPINLDDGFDVYATQAFNAPNGKAYAISWVGLPDVEYPTDNENWANCLSQVKELSLKKGRLIQRPVAAMGTLRQAGHLIRTEKVIDSRQVVESHAGQQYELKITIARNQRGTLHLAGNHPVNQSLQLNFNTGKDAFFEIDRSKAGQTFNEKFGTTRKIRLPENQDLDLDIFIDHSLAEVFVNNGEHVMTLRYFADPKNDKIAFTGKNSLNYYGTFWNLADM